MNKYNEDTGENLRFLVKTSSFVFLSIIISKFFSYIYKIVVARSFGPEPYGLFSIAIIVSSLFVTFASLGLSDGLTRFIPYYRGKSEYKKINYLINMSFVITILTSLLALVSLYFFSDTIALSIFNNINLSIYLKIISLVAPFAVISNIYLTVLRGFERVKTYSVLINLLQNGSKLLLLIILIYLGFGANSLTLSYLISFAILAGFSYYLGRRVIIAQDSKGSLNALEKKKVVNDLLSYSWPLIFAGSLYTLFYWTDSLVIGYFKEAAYVGIYNSAITLATLFSIAPDLFMQLFLPLITKKYSEKKNVLIKDLSKQVSKWIYLINLPILMFIIAFPGGIINFFFGQAFLMAETPLRILAFGALFSGFLSLLFGLISMRGDSKTILRSYLTFVTINLVLDIIFVQFWGMVGAAIATTLVWILFNLSLTFIVRKRLGFFIYKWILVKITLVTGILMVLLIILGKLVTTNLINLVIIGIIFTLVYVAIITLSGCLDENDMMILKSIRNKLKDTFLIKKK